MHIWQFVFSFSYAIYFIKDIKMLKISTIKDKFVINHDDKTTVIPFSDFISFALFQYSDGKTYKSEVNFISEKKLNNFFVSNNRYNGKFINNFYSFSNKNPFKNKTTIESNPFTTIDNPTFIEVQVRKNCNDFTHYINLNYFTGFDIVFDNHETDSAVLFKIKLNDNLSVETKPFELKTCINLYVGDQVLCVETECFVMALQNIKNPSQKVLDILDFIQKTLVNNNVQVLK